MRVLVVSRTPWNSSNSFGNTFTNLFGGMDGVNIYNICCQSGSNNNNVVKDTLQLSESILLRIIKRHNNEVFIEDGVGIQYMQAIGKQKRSTWMFIARDIIWFMTAFKWKRMIMDFIEKIKPDLFYMPIYASWYMCSVDSYIIKKTFVPVVGHISDDVYGCPPVISSFSLSHYYRRKLRNKIRSLIDKTSYLEVFAENMKVAYEKEFKRPCHVIGKGINPSEVNTPRIRVWGDEVHFIYTGGLGGGRLEVLRALAMALSQNKSGKRCFLDIYSATPLSERDKREMIKNDSIVFHGAVSGSEVKKVQLDADCLVHVEAFSPEAIFEAGMSFSTKIIDYLATGNLMLAIGPSVVNSIKVLYDRKIAIVIDDKYSIGSIIDQLLNGTYDVEVIKNNAYCYLLKERDISAIQRGIYQRMKAICMSNPKLS